MSRYAATVASTSSRDQFSGMSASYTRSRNRADLLVHSEVTVTNSQQKPSHERSENMRRIGSTGTLPELVVRRLLRELGIGYRLRSRLPGRPDIVCRGRQRLIFVHGCFWHAHQCSRAHVPLSNVDYWSPKLQRTTIRDRQNGRILREAGWRILVIWECELKHRYRVRAKLKRFFRDR